MNNTNILQITESELLSMVEMATVGILNEQIPSYVKGFIFHFTTVENALKIMRSDSMILSTSTPGSADEIVIKPYYRYLSFTKNGKITKSQYPQQQLKENKPFCVRFIFNHNKLMADGYEFIDMCGEKSYMKIQANRLLNKTRGRIGDVFYKNGLSKDKTNKEKWAKELYKIAEKLDTEEIRLVSNKGKIDNIFDYIEFVDILNNETYSQIPETEKIKHAIEASVDEKWFDKIRIFGNDRDFDITRHNSTVDSKLPLDKLTKSERKLITSMEQTLNESVVTSLAKILYMFNYSPRGFEYIKSQVIKKMKKFGMNITINITASKSSYQMNLINAVVNKLNIAQDYFNSNSKNVYAEIGKEMRDMRGHLAGCISSKIGLCDMYIDWLSKYTKIVKKRVSVVDSEMKNIATKPQLESFIKKYKLVFYNAVINLLEKTNLIDTAKNFEKRFKESITSLNEGRHKKQNNELPFINYIFDVLTMFGDTIIGGIESIRKDFMRSYSNTYYNYDELMYFKRDVISSKIQTISDLRSSLKKNSRSSDLYNLYGGDAAVANDENNL